MGAFEYVGEWISSLVRAAEITVVAMVSVVAYSVGALRRLVMRDRARREQHRAHYRGMLLRWSFARLGATFIKIGQVMSSRPDLFSAGVIAELRWLQDRVPPFPFEQVRRIVEHELAAPLEHRFREFCPTSVAAGSVAQVHRAILHDGDEVAVKVLRPNILPRVRRDARLLLWLAHVVHALSARARTANVIGHTRDLVAGILAQTDLRTEANNYEQFRRNFAGTPRLAFPRVYRRYSTRWVMTMEYIHGTRIDEGPAVHLPEAARVIRSMFFAMCFDHGFVHADLHPGNVLIRPGGGVVILDVGLVKRIPRDLVRQVADFTRCLAGGNARDLVAHLRRYHRYLDNTDWQAVETDAAAFIARIREKPIVQLELSVIIGDLFSLARKHRIRPMPDMALVLLGMVTSEGMAKRLDPECDTISELAKYLGPHLAPKRRLARGSRDWTRSSRALLTDEHTPGTKLVVCRAPRHRPRRIERLTERIDPTRTP